MRNFQHRFHLNSHIVPFVKGHSWSSEEEKWKRIEYVTAWNLICIYLNIAICCWKKFKHSCADPHNETQWNCSLKFMANWNALFAIIHNAWSEIKGKRNKHFIIRRFFLQFFVLYLTIATEMECADDIGFTAIKLSVACCLCFNLFS